MRNFVCPRTIQHYPLNDKLDKNNDNDDPPDVDSFQLFKKTSDSKIKRKRKQTLADTDAAEHDKTMTEFENLVIPPDNCNPADILPVVDLMKANQRGLGLSLIHI